MKVNILFTVLFCCVGFVIAQNSTDVLVRMEQLQKEIAVLAQEREAEIKVSTTLREQHRARMQSLAEEASRIQLATDSMNLVRTRLLQTKAQNISRDEREKARYQRQQQSLVHMCDSVLATLATLESSGAQSALQLLRERLVRSDVSLQEGWGALWNIMLQTMELGFKWELQNTQISIASKQVEGQLLKVGQALSYFIPTNGGFYYRSGVDWHALEPAEPMRKYLEHMIGVMQGRLAPDLTALPLLPIPREKHE
jgi:hypothetical protein